MPISDLPPWIVSLQSTIDRSMTLNSVDDLRTLADAGHLDSASTYVVGAVRYRVLSPSTYVAEAEAYPGQLGGVVYDVAGRAVEWTVDGVTFSVTYTSQGMTIQSSDGLVREVSFDPLGRIDAAQLLGT